MKRALFQAVDTTESGLVSRKECLDGIPQCVLLAAGRVHALELWGRVSVSVRGRSRVKVVFVRRDCFS